MSSSERNTKANGAAAGKAGTGAAQGGDAPANTPGGRGTGGLAPFRARLDFLDGEILRLLGERFDVCRQVAHHKREHDIPMMQPQRVIEVRERYLRRGAESNLPSDFSAALFELLIGATCKMEDELIAQPSAAGDGIGK
ncbi:MAG: chorismate mutase [Solirubrobacteraceae bacterium]